MTSCDLMKDQCEQTFVIFLFQKGRISLHIESNKKIDNIISGTTCVLTKDQGEQTLILLLQKRIF